MTTADAAREAVGQDERRLRRRRWAGLVVVATAQLVVMVDETIVNIAMPSVQKSLGLADADRQWVITAYTLTFGGLLLLGGRLADRFGPRATFLVGLTGFALASAIGGSATSPGLLIGARAIQGLFAAVLSPSTLTMITALFEDRRERATAFGAYSAIIASGAVVGLLAGGVLTEYLNWRWCLFVNVPIIAIAVAVAPPLLPTIRGDRAVRPGVAGGLLACAGIATLVFGILEVPEHGLTSLRVSGLLAGAAALLTGFVLHQSRARQPLLPPRVLTDRDRVGAFVAVALMGFGMLGVSLFATYQLQVVMRYSPIRAGLAFLPMVAVAMLAATQLAARLLPRVAPRYLMGAGLLCTASGVAMFTAMSTHTSYVSTVLPTWVLLGLGLGLTTPSATNTVMYGTLPHDRGVTAAFRTTSQQVGGSLGLVVANTVAAGATVSHAAPDGSASTDRAVGEALAHGTSVAATWSSGLLVAGTVVVFALVNHRPKAA